MSDETLPASPAAGETVTIPAEQGIIDAPKAPKSKKAAPAATPEPAPAEITEDKPVCPFAEVRAVIGQDLPDYKTLVVGDALMIGVEPQISVDCKVTRQGDRLTANYYGFINKDKREKIQKALSGIGVANGTSPFLHRNGR